MKFTWLFLYCALLTRLAFAGDELKLEKAWNEIAVGLHSREPRQQVLSITSIFFLDTGAQIKHKREIAEELPGMIQLAESNPTASAPSLLVLSQHGTGSASELGFLLRLASDKKRPESLRKQAFGLLQQYGGKSNDEAHKAIELFLDEQSNELCNLALLAIPQVSTKGSIAARGYTTRIIDKIDSAKSGRIVDIAAAFDALTHIEGNSPIAVDTLTKALKSGDPNIRALAVTHLARIPPLPDLVVVQMAELLSDGDDSVTKSAIVALQRLGTQAIAAQCLVKEALANSNNDAIKEDLRNIIRALEQPTR